MLFLLIAGCLLILGVTLALRAAPGSVARRTNQACAALALMFIGFRIERTMLPPRQYLLAGVAVVIGLWGIRELLLASKQRRAEAQG